MLLRFPLFIFLVAFTSAAGASEAPLTGEQVLDWMRTRADAYRLQMRMKANAAQYDDLPRAFYQKRDAWLKTRGWEVDDYEAMGERIIMAINGMHLQDELDARAADREEERASIRGNAYYTEEQKRQMLEMLEGLHQAKVDQIEMTRPDWPAVEPYREKLQRLTDWLAGNVDSPPEL